MKRGFTDHRALGVIRRRSTCVSSLLVVLIACILIIVGAHGPNLFPVFFGDIGRLAWTGRFNLDFMGIRSLSCLWLAWRHHLTAGGVASG